MKYLVLLLADGDEKPWDEQTDEEQAALLQRFEDFDAACRQRGVVIAAGEALAPGDTATVMRTRGGEVTLTDGPYAEAIEGLGGFFLLDAPDLDVVLELMKVLPAYDMQVQPAVDLDG